jgi:hypothetical protein
MFCRRLIYVAIFGWGAACAAQTLDQLQEQWRAIRNTPPHDFAQLVPKLVRYRDRQGGKSWQLNYMLGSSYCQIGQTENGKIALHRVLGSIGLPQNARDAAEEVLANCGGTSVPAQEPSLVLVPVSGQLGPIWHGKGGYEIDEEATPVANKPRISPVPVSELKKRIYGIDHAQDALNASLARQDGRARGAFASGFVVTSTVPLSPEETGKCLALYRRPLKAQFQMESPEPLITVYVVKLGEVPKYAQDLHGVKLPLGTVAYSVFEDLSIVGVAGYSTCGSLAHELVHLSIRVSFGDAPAWLEEGLASAVAVARPQEDTFRFGKSWREDMLNRHWDLRPSVAQLLDKTWTDYTSDQAVQMSRVAALHAMAASFIRYLDSKNKLVPVYLAIRDTLSKPTARSDKDILEAELAMSVERIDADFVQWLGRKAP